MSKLAILGGDKIRINKFPPYSVIGNEEELAIKRVMDSQVFSRFLGTWHKDFYGGPEVNHLEKQWSDYYGVKNSVAVNSATSGLYCAVGAAGIGPGDEVLVSPYTMSASAIAPLIFNAIPVFCDIETEYFCLDPDSIEKNITERTKAIIVVDIFGQPYNAERINKIAEKYNLTVIEDNAQAPGAQYYNKPAGTLGDIGIFSLNYHKHIHTGEGGIVVTDDDELAEKVRLIRNHAEAVVESKGVSDIVNMIGFNFRMNEIEAAIAGEQLKKLNLLTEKRIENVKYLEKKLSDFPFLEMPAVREGAKHVYYLHCLKFNEEAAGIHRDKFVEAVAAELAPIERRETEGIKIGKGYVKPLYLQPLFQKRIAYGADGCPWTCDKYKGKVSYEKGICANAEDLYENKLITHEYMRPGMTEDDLNDVVRAFEKVWENIEDLK